MGPRRAVDVGFVSPDEQVLVGSLTAQALMIEYETACMPELAVNDQLEIDGQPHGNTYMQVVSFPPGGVQAHTLLTFSLSDDPASAHYGDYTRAYSAQQWLRLPFSEAEIAADPSLRSVTVRQ